MRPDAKIDLVALNIIRNHSTATPQTRAKLQVAIVAAIKDAMSEIECPRCNAVTDTVICSGCGHMHGLRP